MPAVLIVHASTHGHTAKIASAVARALQGDGVDVDVRDVASAAELAPSDYDAVIVGASVHGGRHQHEIVDWARGHHITLSGMPSAFFSVCLTAADDTAESREATRAYIDDFEDDTGWMPRKRVSFAGALQYREYDFATRLVMRLLMRRGHHPTDVTQDHDYTDWEAVDRFAHGVRRDAARRRPVAARRELRPRDRLRHGRPEGGADRPRRRRAGQRVPGYRGSGAARRRRGAAAGRLVGGRDGRHARHRGDGRPARARRPAVDLRDALAETRERPESASGMAPVYGMAAQIPDRTVVADMLAGYMDLWYRV